MSISTFSVFYTTIVVNSENNYINFDEGAAEFSPTIDGGSYTVTEILTAIKTAMDGAGALTYTVALDRDTRQVTISSTANFSLLLSTGSQVSNAIWSSIGFTSGADLSAASTYTGASGAATEYKPQFIMQDYIESQNFKQKISPTVNESASGKIEVVSFGTRQFFEMSFKFITDLAMDGVVIKNNPSGISDFRAFLDSIILKGNLEFIPDIGDRSTFFKVLLEDIPSGGGGKGTGYKLVELTSKNLPGIYELNKIRFRVVS